MNKGYTLAALGGAAVGLAGASAISWARAKKGQHARPLVALHPDEVRFEPIVQGASRAVLWGNPERGSYAAFVRFEPGAYHPLHTHPNDIILVVLEGAYIYGAGDETIRVGPRAVFFLPAGVPHVSGADAVEGCLMFETSPARFGMDFLEEAPAVGARVEAGVRLGPLDARP